MEEQINIYIYMYMGLASRDYPIQIYMDMFYCLLDAPHPPLNRFREGEPLAHRSARLRAPYQNMWRASWQLLPPSLKKKLENAGSKPGYGETCVFGAAD